MGFGGLGGRSRGGSPEYIHHEVKAVTLIGGGEPASALRRKGMIGEIAKVFLSKKWTLVYCGMGEGIAGEIAQQVLAAGGKVVAVVVERRVPRRIPAGAELVKVADFHERRRQLFDLGDGALVVPGGSGTIAELTDLVAWKDAGLYRKALVVYDPEGWFRPLEEFYAAAFRHRVTLIRKRDMWARPSSPARIVFNMQNELC